METAPALLRDYLLLRGEIIRHKMDPVGYEPPAGDISQEQDSQIAPNTQDPWPVISAFRRGAEQIV